MHACVYRPATASPIGATAASRVSIGAPAALIGAGIGIPLVLVLVALVGFAAVRYKTKKAEHDVQHTNNSIVISKVCNYT